MMYYQLLHDDSKILLHSLFWHQGPTTAFWEMVDEENQLVILACVLAASGLCLILSRYFNRSKPTLQRRSKKALLWKQEYVNTHVKPEKVSYKYFLEQFYISSHNQL